MLEFLLGRLCRKQLGISFRGKDHFFILVLRNDDHWLLDQDRVMIFVRLFILLSIKEKNHKINYVTHYHKETYCGTCLFRDEHVTNTICSDSEQSWNLLVLILVNLSSRYQTFPSKNITASRYEFDSSLLW